MPSTRSAASRQVANASGRISSSVSPVCQPVFQLIGLSPQRFVGHGAVFLFQREHFVAQGLDAFDLPLAVIAEKRFQKSHGS